MKRWLYRKRVGVRIGKWVFGYERRDYRFTAPIAWPAVYRDPCAQDDRPDHTSLT